MVDASRKDIVPMLKLKVTLNRIDYWIILGIFFVNLSIGVALFSGNYGFNDDYVLVGQFKQSDFNFLQALKWGLDSPYSAGRFLYCLAIAIVSPLLKSVETLIFIRILSVIGWCLTSVFIFKYLRKAGARRLDAATCAQIVYLIPGVLLHQASAAQYPYGWASLIALIAGNNLHKNTPTKFIAYIQSLILTIISIMIYQPAGALVLFVPIIRLILQSNQRNSRILTLSTKVFLVALGSNYLLARLLYTSPRLENKLDVGDKVSQFFQLVIPSSLFVFEGVYNYNFYLKIFLMMLCIFIVLFYFYSNRENQSEGIFNKINRVLVATLFMPVTLGWLIFVPEDGVSQRKIMWGSLISLNIIYLMIVSLKGKTMKLIRISAITAVIASMITWPHLVRSNLIELQINEWSAAKCASRIYVISQEYEFGSYSSRLNYEQKKLEYQDEYAVLSSNFPGPRIFMPFLANNETNLGNIVESAWTLKLSNEESIKNDIWGKNFIECFNKK